MSIPIKALSQTECPEYAFTKITDSTTPVPGGNGGTFEGLSQSEPAVTSLRVAFYGEDDGTFSGFDRNVATDGGEVAFSAAGSGFSGLFVPGESGLCRVIDTDNTSEGKDVIQLFMGRDSYSVGMLGFQAVFSNGSRRIYLAKAPRSSPDGALPTSALFILLDEWG